MWESEILYDWKEKKKPLLPGSLMQAACLTGMYAAQRGRRRSPNDNKARELRLGMETLAAHHLPLLRIKSWKERGKQLWSALSSLSLCFCMSCTCSLYREPFRLLPSAAVELSSSELLLPTWYYDISCHCSNNVRCSRRMNLTRHWNTHTLNSHLLEVWYDA